MNTHKHTRTQTQQILHYDNSRMQSAKISEPSPRRLKMFTSDTVYTCLLSCTRDGGGWEEEAGGTCLCAQIQSLDITFPFVCRVNSTVLTVMYCTAQTTFIQLLQQWLSRVSHFDTLCLLYLLFFWFLQRVAGDLSSF